MKGPLSMDDPRILNFIWSGNYITPPVGSEIPYNLNDPSTDPSMGQSAIVKDIFHGSRGGFFIEVGALDGETRSNTLSLEREYGWKGLLIEADSSNFELLLKKKRKAYAASCCLAIHPYPHEVIYEQAFNVGKIKQEPGSLSKDANPDPNVNTLPPKTIRAQCFPILSLLRAINVSTVDYFSLDVEGFELDVLKTIPFDLILIKVLSVEFTHTFSGAESLEKFMTEKNYRVLTKITNDRSLANDFIFIHPCVKINKRFPKVINTP